MIVDNQSFNIDAIIILLKYVFKLDTETICTRAMNGQDAQKIIQEDIEEGADDGLTNAFFVQELSDTV